MFTIKVCNQGTHTYFETDAVTQIVLEDGFISLRFKAQGEERDIIFWGLATGDKEIPEYLPSAERAYIMNDQGKTIDIIR